MFFVANFLGLAIVEWHPDDFLTGGLRWNFFALFFERIDKWFWGIFSLSDGLDVKSFSDRAHVVTDFGVFPEGRVIFLTVCIFAAAFFYALLWFKFERFIWHWKLSCFGFLIAVKIFPIHFREIILLWLIWPPSIGVLIIRCRIRKFWRIWSIIWLLEWIWQMICFLIL